MPTDTKRKPLDWVCDHCGRKVYHRRDPPVRCHAMPMRPMGSPWKHGADRVYSLARDRPRGWLAKLPDDYWVTPLVMARLKRAFPMSDDD
jgi:hypothetical protein